MAGSLPELVERLDRCLKQFGASEIQDITDVYNYYPDFRRSRLGSGSYGEAFMVTSRTNPHEPLRVAKIIPKARITRTSLQVQHICAEIAVTTKLKSSYLNQAAGLYHSSSHLFLVLETCDAPVPDIRTRLYHLFARYHPVRIAEVESMAVGFEKEWEDEALRRKDDQLNSGVEVPPAVTELEKNQFFDSKMAIVLAQLGVRQEAPTRTDLFNSIVHHKRVPDAKAAVIIKQCLQGLEFMHNHQVIHRDIKTENVILGETRTSEPIRDENGAVVGVRLKEKIQTKLIDFGLVKYMRLAAFPLSPSPGTFENAIADPFASGAVPGAADPFASGAVPGAPPQYQAPTEFPVTVTPCGTELYCALEVLTGILDTGAGNTKWQSSSETLPKLDVYGCGTMLFCMANGRAPFRLAQSGYRAISRAEKLRQIQQLIAAGPLFSASVSESQKDMVLKLMRNNAGERPSAAQALLDPYFQTVGTTYAYEVRCDGQVSVIAEPDHDAAEELKEDILMEVMRGKEDAGDAQGKEQPDEDETSSASAPQEETSSPPQPTSTHTPDEQ